MSNVQTVSVERVVAAPIEQVFEWLSDARNYTRSAFVLHERLVRRGEDTAYGLGAIRQLTWVFGWFRERVTTVEMRLPIAAAAVTRLLGRPLIAYTFGKVIEAANAALASPAAERKGRDSNRR